MKTNKEELPLLDEQGSQNFFNQIMELWIKPEVQKRKKLGKIDDNFVLKRCLIKMPKNKPVIIEFNEKCKMELVVRKDHDTFLQEKDLVHNFQVNEILDTLHPKIDNIAVAFIFLQIVKGKWNIFFDLAPSHEDKSQFENDWYMGKIIANSLQESLEEQTAVDTILANKLLNDAGLWPIPALIHYPMSKIVHQLFKSDKDGALKTLQKFCNTSFFNTQISRWFKNTSFKKRKRLFIEAHTTHKRGLYTQSILSLLPHIEGIITDCLYETRSESENIPYQLDKKMELFYNKMLNSNLPIPDNLIVESTIKFMKTGPLFRPSGRWTKKDNTRFPKRHSAEHGKYDDSMYTKLNSIKLLLLFDTLHYLLSKRLPAP